MKAEINSKKSLIDLDPLFLDTCYRSNLVKSQSFIHNYVKHRVYNRSDCLDVIQEVNRVAIEKESHYIEGDDKKNSKFTLFKKWISGICRFQVLAFFSASKRNKLTYLEDIYSVFNPTDPMPIPSRDLIKKEISEEFDGYLDALSNRERQVLSLLKLGYRQVDIARKLSIDPCHVSAYKKNGIIKIKSNHALTEA